MPHAQLVIGSGGLGMDALPVDHADNIKWCVSVSGGSSGEAVLGGGGGEILFWGHCKKISRAHQLILAPKTPILN